MGGRRIGERLAGRMQDGRSFRLFSGDVLEEFLRESDGVGFEFPQVSRGGFQWQLRGNAQKSFRFRKFAFFCDDAQFAETVERDVLHVDDMLSDLGRHSDGPFAHFHFKTGGGKPV